jgi:hypothetical protein
MSPCGSADDLVMALKTNRHPVEIRLLEQFEHLLEIPVIDVSQHVLLFGAELVAPPGPLGLPTLDLSAVDPDETKIPLLGPRRYVLRLGAIQFRRRLKRLGGAEQRTQRPNQAAQRVLRFGNAAFFPHFETTKTKATGGLRFARSQKGELGHGCVRPQQPARLRASPGSGRGQAVVTQL